ncbi:hypothetical protein SSBG_03143 [Streptomyces sp. SPB074]|nr:hypothetical protein SSBG_03143 [Streptomyces sp. SPB074]
MNTALSAHPAYARGLDRLRAMGVRLGSCAPHRPGSGGAADRFRWEEALDLLTEASPDPTRN